MSEKIHPDKIGIKREGLLKIQNKIVDLVLKGAIKVDDTFFKSLSLDFVEIDQVDYKSLMFCKISPYDDLRVYIVSDYINIDPTMSNDYYLKPNVRISVFHLDKRFATIKEKEMLTMEFNLVTEHDLVIRLVGKMIAEVFDGKQ